MHQLSSLTSITGGYYSSRRSQPSTPLASVSPVLDNPKDIGTYDTEGMYIEPVRACRTHITSLPKTVTATAWGRYTAGALGGMIRIEFLWT